MMRVVHYLSRRQAWTVPGTVTSSDEAALPALCSVQASHGALWVTQEGDIQDYVVLPGTSWTSRGRGQVVIQALEDAQFEVGTGNPQPDHVAGDEIAA